MLKIKQILVALLVSSHFMGSMLISPSANAADGEKKPKSMSYIPMDPVFVVNFPPESETRFLQIALEIGAKDKDVINVIENNRPAIRHNLVFLFSDQSPAPLKTREGKDKLREEALAQIQQVIDEEGVKGSVEMVFFTSFVMQ